MELFKQEDLRNATADMMVNLKDLPYDRFTGERLAMRNPVLLKDTSRAQDCQDQLFASFFLDIDYKKSQNRFKSDIFRIISSFNRKQPEVTDIFNRNLTDLSKDFTQLVQHDREQLSSFLSKEQAMMILNETYNYMNFENFGHISEDDLIKISLILLPEKMKNLAKIKAIYA